jgi:hypothetical protein
MGFRCSLLLMVALLPAFSQTRKDSPSRSADGKPDLSGVWNNASLTPLERPASLGDKQFFTEQEAAQFASSKLKDVNRDRRDGSNQADLDRAYNEAFFDRGTNVSRTMRTSLIVDPANGKVPPLTPDAAKKWKQTQAYFELHPGDGPEERPLPDRCLMFSQAGPPMFPGNYNDNYLISQTKDYLVIRAEMGDIARIIPLNGRAHIPSSIRQWSGDPVGHWEGNTIVVDSTNFRATARSRFGVVYDGMTDENLHVVERFTREGPDMIRYKATVDDPTVYSQPWTVEIAMNQVKDRLFEYACHEGNYGMSGVLSGYRAQEK